MPNLDRIKIGALGEDLATGYLVEKGWIVIARNYREKFDEIDIIAMSNDGVLVFFEVKSRLLRGGRISRGGLTPEDNLTHAKFRKISRVCRMFAGRRPELINPEKGWRIDLLAVDIGPSGAETDIRHYENIA